MFGLQNKENCPIAYKKRAIIMHDPYASSVVKNDRAVRHVPKNFSRVFCLSTKWFHSLDLPQGGLEIPCTLAKKRRIDNTR